MEVLQQKGFRGNLILWNTLALTLTWDWRDSRFQSTLYLLLYFRTAKTSFLSKLYGHWKKFCQVLFTTIEASIGWFILSIMLSVYILASCWVCISSLEFNSVCLYISSLHCGPMRNLLCTYLASQHPLIPKSCSKRERSNAFLQIFPAFQVVLGWLIVEEVSNYSQAEDPGRALSEPRGN